MLIYHPLVMEVVDRSGTDYWIQCNQQKDENNVVLHKEMDGSGGYILSC